MSNHLLGIVLLLSIIGQAVAGEDIDILNAALFEAIERRDLLEVSRIVELGADLIGARDGQGRSPLVAARQQEALDVFEHLLICGADPNAPAFRTGDSVLRNLTGPTAAPYLILFLRFGGDINAPVTIVSGKPTPYFSRVVSAGFVDLAKLALEAGAQRVTYAHNKFTYLQLALNQNQVRMASFLLRSGILADHENLESPEYDAFQGPKNALTYNHWQILYEVDRQRLIEQSAKRQDEQTSPNISP